MKRISFALAFALSLLLTTSVAAQQPDIVKLNEDGIKAYSEGRFADAAAIFNQAYAVQPDQTLKKNEAVAWFKADQCDNALKAAREFLALNPADTTSIGEAQAVMLKCDIKAAEASVAAGDTDTAETVLTEAKTLNPDPESQAKIAALEEQIAVKKKADEEARQQAAAAAEKKRQEEAAAEADEPSGSGNLGMILAGAGGAVFVGALTYHLVMALGVAPKFRDVAAEGTDREKYDKLGKTLETARWLVPTLYVVGAGTAGVGVYFMMQGSAETAGQERGTHVGIALQGRF